MVLQAQQPHASFVPLMPGHFIPAKGVLLLLHLSSMCSFALILFFPWLCLLFSQLFHQVPAFQPSSSFVQFNLASLLFDQPS